MTVAAEQNQIMPPEDKHFTETFWLVAIRMASDMKRLLILFLFAAAVSVGAAEVDVTLKNGRKVTGGVLVDNDREIIILVQASNGVYRQTIKKADVAAMKEHAAPKSGPPGLADVARLQKSIKAAEEDVHRREAEIPIAQKALDDFYGSHPDAKAATLDKERKLRARLATTRTQVEIARSKLNALTLELETMSLQLTAPPQAK